MGRLGGWLGAGVGVPLCPAWPALGVRAVSHPFQAVVRRESRAWALGMCGCGGWGARVVPISQEAWWLPCISVRVRWAYVGVCAL